MLSDQELVEQARSGSRDAFAEIYTRHRGGVYNYCLRLVKDDQAAEDVVHETFLRMHSGLHGLRNGMALRVWLLSIARNFALNALRKTNAIEPLTEDLETDDDSPFDLVVRDERAQSVRSLIESLNPSLREVLVLKEFEELSYREIAVVTGLSEENVKIRIYRARKAIALELKKNP